MTACNKLLKKSRLFSQTNKFIKRHVSAKAFIFEKQFDGFPKESDFKLVTEELPALKDGEFLAAAEYLSVDPYMRAYAPRVKTGRTFMGSQVAKIVESKNSKFPEGTYIVGEYGWRTHTISNGKGAVNGLPSVWIIPDIEDLPHSLALGVLGMPGNTAYFGFLELCQPKVGETVIVTGAAGAVGSHVGQIAKIKGCRTVGVAGSDEKGKWLVDELGFDHFINYKKDDLRSKIKEFAPYDCYFDNVGGEISSMIMLYMSLFGRISVCGAISGYNDTSLPKAPIVQYPLVFNQLRMEGFVVQRWVDRWFEGVEQNKKWIQEGKLKYRETVTHGFENMYAAFADMLRGGNTGKAIVKV
ncbi:prostaglandin reductase 1-like [Diabrotica virgifera virgifera]|uniref:Prostaglandin reductase 1 n=1 Tax=Diabrotica virgifera virgifera TaxID=50390 RepID=A0A6P7GXP1_DIAVI|nr:prostaglandin reductase 1-like [Diabrotica virgifera virgifera]